MPGILKNLLHNILIGTSTLKYFLFFCPTKMIGLIGQTILKIE